MIGYIQQQANYCDFQQFGYIKTLNDTIKLLVGELVRVKGSTNSNKASAFVSRFNCKVECVHKVLTQMEKNQDWKEKVSDSLKPLLDSINSQTSQQTAKLSKPVLQARTQSQPLNKSFAHSEPEIPSLIGVTKSENSSKSGSINTSFDMSIPDVELLVDLPKVEKRVQIAPLSSSASAKIKGSKIPRIKPTGLKMPTKVLHRVSKKPEAGPYVPKTCKVVSFSPGKLDTDDEEGHELGGENFSQPGSSTCAYSDYFPEDVIVEEPEEESL